MKMLAHAAAAAITAIALQGGGTSLVLAQGPASAPNCLPTSPRIPATLQPAGTIAPIVQPFADLPPNPEPPPALSQMAPVPEMNQGRTAEIDERIRELRSRLTRPASATPMTRPAVPAVPMGNPATATEPAANPAATIAPGPASGPTPPPAAAYPATVPPPPPPGLEAGPADLLTEPPAAPIGSDPAVPAPQQSISPRSTGLDPAKTNLIPPAPPPLGDAGGTNPFRPGIPGVVPPNPSASEIHSGSLSALSIPVEILRSPIDHIALADNLYAARSYGLALEAYQSAAKATGPAASRRWANFQIANCYRHLGQSGEAERQYRRVAGDRDAGQLTDYAKWWLQAMEQRTQLTSQLNQLKTSLEATPQGSDNASPPAAPQP